MRKIIVAALSLAITGTVAAQNNPALPDNELPAKTLVALTKDQQDTAIARASENLLDPYTAHFRYLTGVKSDSQKEAYVCGEVNAKNDQGNYMGYIPFFLSKESGMAMGNGSDSDRQKIRMFCPQH